MQVGRASEEGEGGRDYSDVLTVRIEALEGRDFEGTEEWKLAGDEFRERYNVLSVAFHKSKMCNLLSTRGNQLHSTNGSIVVGSNI